MPLIPGLAILAMSVALGGLAALYRERASKAMPSIRTFAIVAAVSIALLHLLPEAVSDAGWPVLLAAAAGAFVPALLERALGIRDAHPHDAPTAALAMGYAAVIAHQAGEGAALASLARTGSLSFGVVASLAAHTVPLAMVVSIRVLEVTGTASRGRRATALALTGLAAGTAAGAIAGSYVSDTRLDSVEPWVLGVAAGLLLHALSHDAFPPPPATRGGRFVDATAGLLGLGLGLFTIEDDGWPSGVTRVAAIVGVLLLAAAIVVRSFVAIGPAHQHGAHRR